MASAPRFPSLSTPGLAGPLHDHLLPCLSAAQLAALRQTCSAARDLVDTDTAHFWREAAEVAYVAPQLLAECRKVSDVQRVLKQQASHIISIKQGRHSGMLVGRGALSHGRSELSWALNEGHSRRLFFIIKHLQPEDGAEAMPHPDTEPEDLGEPMTAEGDVIKAFTAADIENGQATSVCSTQTDLWYDVVHICYNDYGAPCLTVWQTTDSGWACSEKLITFTLCSSWHSKFKPEGVLQERQTGFMYRHGCAGVRMPGIRRFAPPVCQEGLLAFCKSSSRIALLDAVRCQEALELELAGTEEPRALGRWQHVIAIAISHSLLHVAVNILTFKGGLVLVYRLRDAFHADEPPQPCRNLFQLPYAHDGEERVTFAWAPKKQSLLFFTDDLAQVIHLFDGAAPSTVSLRLHEVGDLVGDGVYLQSRWAPCGTLIVIANFRTTFVQPAGIFEATSGGLLCLITMEGCNLWPRWTLAWSHPEQGPPNKQWLKCTCLVPGRQTRRLDFIHGSQQVFEQPCGMRWSRISPCSTLVVTLLVRDAPSTATRCGHRDTRYLNSLSASLVGFRHERDGQTDIEVASGRMGGRYPVAPPEQVELQSHPCLVAWLPGTLVYAAAALNHIWIVDGHTNRISACWRQDDVKLRAVKTVRCPFRTSKDYAEGVRVSRCTGLSWSPDRGCLAWVTSESFMVVRFGQYDRPEPRPALPGMQTYELQRYPKRPGTP